MNILAKDTSLTSQTVSYMCQRSIMAAGVLDISHFHISPLLLAPSVQSHETSDVKQSHLCRNCTIHTLTLGRCAKLQLGYFSLIAAMINSFIVMMLALLWPTLGLMLCLICGWWPSSYQHGAPSAFLLLAGLIGQIFHWGQDTVISRLSEWQWLLSCCSMDEAYALLHERCASATRPGLFLHIGISELTLKCKW